MENRLEENILQKLLTFNFDKTDNPEKIIKLLKEEINRHNYFYYIKDSPLISDSDYDRLLRNLEKLEAKYPSLVTSDSPTQRIGAPLE